MHILNAYLIVRILASSTSSNHCRERGRVNGWRSVLANLSYVRQVTIICKCITNIMYNKFKLCFNWALIETRLVLDWSQLVEHLLLEIKGAQNAPRLIKPNWLNQFPRPLTCRIVKCLNNPVLRFGTSNNLCKAT